MPDPDHIDGDEVMISVKIMFFAAFRELVGKKEIKLELGSQEKYTMSDVLNELMESKGIPIKSMLLDDEGNLRKGVQIFINGVKIHISDKVETPIKNDDIIAILPTVGGGRTIPRFLPYRVPHGDIPDACNTL